jgi:hypothetical protein
MLALFIFSLEKHLNPNPLKANTLKNWACHAMMATFLSIGID